jgi:hypothetical protein
VKIENGGMKKIYIYLIGAIPLGLNYNSLKSMFSNPLYFFILVILYLCLVRLVAEKIGRP